MDVYAPPVEIGSDSYALTAAYRTTAKKVAAGQIELVGERLASSHNSDLR